MNKTERLLSKFYFTTSSLLLILSVSMFTVNAAQSDKIITVITQLTQDIYSDFVYLSLGFTITIVVWHLIMIIFSAGDEQTRRTHVRAIITAVIAWAIINVFAYFIAKIFNLTGQNTPADIFNVGGYGN